MEAGPFPTTPTEWLELLRSRITSDKPIRSGGTDVYSLEAGGWAILPRWESIDARPGCTLTVDGVVQGDDFSIDFVWRWGEDGPGMLACGVVTRVPDPELELHSTI